MEEFLTIPIKNETDFGIVSKQLHDAVFRQEWAFFDSEAHTFKIKLWREVPEKRITKPYFLIFRKTIFLRAACFFTLSFVISANIKVRDKLNYYSLFRLVFDPKKNLLIFETEGTIEICLQLEKIKGDLSDTGEISWEQFGYSTFSVGLPWKIRNKLEN